MKNLGKFAVIGTALAVFASLATTANASVMGTAYCDLASSTGSGQQGTGDAILTPTLANLSTAESNSAGVCATFSASGINFASGSDATAAVSPGVNGGTSLADFLNYGGDIIGSVSYTAEAAKNGGAAATITGSQDDGGTLLVLTGSTNLTSGESITLNHDDGAYIYVCLISSADCGSSAGFSIISGEPANSGVQTVDGQSPFTFGGATGSYDFELIYNSNYEQPSDLQSNIATPEPSSLLLLGTGLIGAAGLMFRRRQTSIL